MDPLVSTRLSLRWPPAPAAEQSDVLVIQGRTGFFLDLRICRTEGRDETDEGKDSVVDWATAGWKRLLPPRDGEEHPRASFEALIDSRRPLSHASASSADSSSTLPAEEAPPDEGSFETLENGDVLETGEMLNTDTGKVQPYEELWRRLPLTQTQDAGEQLQIVILESEGEGEKAFLGRVGDWELGMVDASDGFGVVRREKRGEHWVEVYRNRAAVGLPSIEGIPPGSARTGEAIELGGRSWHVVELE
ncbi:hypothetical protein JCM11641_004483 [Rhodosporidiobolus odoratus]